MQLVNSENDNGTSIQPFPAHGVDRTILVIDDDGSMRLLTATTLRKSNFRVVEAAGGKEGLALLRSRSFSAVILDLRMPGLDGFEVCREIRRQPQNHDIPVMVVSARHDADCIERAYRCGATDYLTKPVNWTQVLRKIELLFSARQASSQLKRALSEQKALVNAIPDTVLRVSESGTVLEVIAGEDCPEVLGRALNGNRGECPNVDPEGSNFDLRALVTCGEQQFQLRDGDIMRQFQARSTSNSDGERLVIIRDTTREKVSESGLKTLAFLDPGTGLGNRNWIQQRADLMIEDALRKGAQAQVFRFVVDNADSMRELLGEDRFERFMLKLANRLLERTGGQQYTANATPNAAVEVGRTDAGEFAVVRICGECEPDADRFARSLAAELERAVELDEIELVARLRVGVASSSLENEFADSLFQLAGIATLDATCSARVCHYDGAIKRNRFRHIDLETRLRRGLREGEISLYYQPQFAADHHRLTGFEALVRWECDATMISPEEFIPVAEASDLILELGDQVLDMACRQIVAWRKAGLSVPPVAVNLSALQLAQEDFYARLTAKLATYALPPGCIEVEITESSLMESSEAVHRTLGAIRAGGMKIALDDFGTGYSSLAYLHDYSLDLVKIDRSFISALFERDRSEDIVRAIVAMAHAMGMQVIAEGVETSEQLAFLEELHCDHVQGYFTGRPQDAEATTRLIRQHGESVDSGLRSVG